MEDILDLYELPYNPDITVLCMDEKPYQLLGETRDPLHMRSGDTRKIDYEYIRNGTCSIFVFVEPLGGVRHVSVRKHCTAVDWADEIRYLVDVSYPDRDNIILVMYNPMPFHPCIGHSLPRKPEELPKDWKFIIPQNMGVGWTLPK